MEGEEGNLNSPSDQIVWQPEDDIIRASIQTKFLFPFPFALGAAFFVAYDSLKRIVEPLFPHQAPIAHMIAASGGEVVRSWNDFVLLEPSLLIQRSFS